MGWFNKKKKEVFYQYIGIKDSELFRSNIESMYEIHSYLKDVKKVFTIHDLEEISKKLAISVPNIDAKIHFFWLEPEKIEERNSKASKTNFKFNLEQFYKVKSIEINFNNLNQFFFISENEKNNLITELERLIADCMEGSIYTTVPDVLGYFGSKNTNIINYHFLINIRQDIYQISKFNDVIDIEKTEELVKKDLAYDIKFFHLNLIRKIDGGIKDIVNEELAINNLFIKSNDKENYVYYDYVNCFKLLGKFYFNDNLEKSSNYFNKIIEIASNISPIFVSSIYKEIGEYYIDKNENKNALFWFKKGLEINPKLSVKKIISKLEKEN